MQGKLHICLRERGAPQVISRADWAHSNCTTDVNELARAGIVKIQQAGDYLLLEPKTLVGVFDSPRLRLEVLAKSPDLANGLLRRLDGWRKRLEVEDPEKLGKIPDSGARWNTFETLLSKVHKEGLPWKYVKVRSITSTPRGSIHFRETISKLISRGICHKVVTSPQVRNHFERFSPALEAVRRRISSLESGAPGLCSRVVRLIELAGDYSVPLDNREANETFEELSLLEGRPALVALCAFCQQLLINGNHIRISRRVGSGVAEFVDLERLWESAVQMLFAQQQHVHYEETALHPLRGSGRTLFDDGGPEIDPDIVLYKGARSVAVIDAKYSVAKSPSADDIYQVTSYVYRIRCNVGILAYVAEGPDTSAKKIGTLDDGRSLFACYLSLNAFDPAAKILEGLLPSEELSVEMP